MTDYSALRQEIIEALMGRQSGTQIQPNKHQDFQLKTLEYIRELELSLQSTLMGFANTNTNPIQPDNARISYIAAVPPNTTSVYSNFYDVNGNSISITTNTNQAFMVILMWNMQFWSYEIIPVSQGVYYSYNIRKTYGSIALMNADVSNPIATDGTAIVIGQLVSVVNSYDVSENGIYSYEGVSWRFQTSLSIFDSDENNVITNISETYSGSTRTIAVDLGLLNNPVAKIEVDDAYTNIKLKVIFKKLNNVRLFIKNIGSTAINYSSTPNLHSSTCFQPLLLFMKNTNDPLIINAGETILIELSAFNVNNNSATQVVQSIKKFDSDILIP